MTNSDWKLAYNLVCEDREHVRVAHDKAVDRIRDLEAELAEARANLARADNELNSAAYNLERRGSELAEARLDGARLDYVLSHTEGDFVIGDVSAEGFWDDMEAEHIGDEREHLRAWRRAIDSALEGKSDDKG